MGLSSVRKTKALAEAEANRFRRDFKKRGITKRRIVVKPVGKTTLKKLMTKKAFNELKVKRRYGVFFFDK